MATKTFTTRRFFLSLAVACTLKLPVSFYTKRTRQFDGANVVCCGSLLRDSRRFSEVTSRAVSRS